MVPQCNSGTMGEKKKDGKLSIFPLNSEQQNKTEADRQPSMQNVMYTSDSALIIFQSSLASPGGVTATNVSCALPSVFKYEACFSVYAAPGSTASAIAAPASPWCPSAWEEV